MTVGPSRATACRRGEPVSKSVDCRLGLIGNNIGRSLAPRLHRLAGGIAGLRVDYPLIDLEDRDPASFEHVLLECGCDGRVGVNVTHPYKERALRIVPVVDAFIRRIGCINTVLFDDGQPSRGCNTDHSGFVTVCHRAFAARRPGVVGVIGAGGVGRPIVAALQQLGAEEVRVFDTDRIRLDRLVDDLNEATAPVRACPSPEAALQDADGIVNATPVGMYRYPGVPVPERAIGRPSWAFDAVYTPIDTGFLRLARAAGAQIITGYELFIHQGIDAFQLFTGAAVDEAVLRAALAEEI